MKKWLDGKKSNILAIISVIIGLLAWAGVIPWETATPLLTASGGGWMLALRSGVNKSGPGVAK